MLISESGGVQLCDFGVAGMMEHHLDKRSTFIGTPNWMAPELFNIPARYGKEVDIWAFGSMAYEMACGMPPSAMSGITGHDLGAYLRSHLPRLEGDQYSGGLKDIVAYCLQESAAMRPTIEQLQKHEYIHGTENLYPTTALIELMRAFKRWEDAGGMRRSLFNPGGAPGPVPLESRGDVWDLDEWNFSTTAGFDKEVNESTNDQDVRNVFGNSVDLEPSYTYYDDPQGSKEKPNEMPAFSFPSKPREDTQPPSNESSGRSRRGGARPPPLTAIPAPIESLFDQNTVTGYHAKAAVHYGREIPMAAPIGTSDLPLRNDTERDVSRESVIDLGDLGDHDEYVPAPYDDLTVRPGGQPEPMDYGNTEENYDTYKYVDYGDAASTNAIDNPYRKTQEWTFPSTPAAATQPKRQPTASDPSRPVFRLGGNIRPSLVHAPYSELPRVGGKAFGDMGFETAPGSPAGAGGSRKSLIDLDFGMLEEAAEKPSVSSEPIDQPASFPTPGVQHSPYFQTPETSRPGTSESSSSRDPFSLERYTNGGGLLQQSDMERHPSLYIPADTPSRNLPHLRDACRGQTLLEALASQSSLSGSTASSSRPSAREFNEQGQSSAGSSMHSRNNSNVYPTAIGLMNQSLPGSSLHSRTNSQTGSTASDTDFDGTTMVEKKPKTRHVHQLSQVSNTSSGGNSSLDRPRIRHAHQLSNISGTQSNPERRRRQDTLADAATATAIPAIPPMPSWPSHVSFSSPPRIVVSDMIAPPSAAALTGDFDNAAMASELKRVLDGFADMLSFNAQVMNSMTPDPPRNRNSGGAKNKKKNGAAKKNGSGGSGGAPKKKEKENDTGAGARAPKKNGDAGVGATALAN